MVPLHLFFPIHPKMPLEMLAGSQIYHNKSSGKNYGLVGYIGNMREQRSAARGEVLLRFGNHNNFVAYSFEWVLANCWVRADSLTPHRAFNLPQFLQKYKDYAAEDIRNIPQDVNHAQIKPVVDHALAVKKAKGVKEKPATSTTAVALQDWLKSHSTLTPRSLAGYMNLLVGRVNLGITIPEHIAAFYSIDPLCVVPVGAFNEVVSGRIPVRAKSRDNGREMNESLPLAVVVGSITDAMFLELHDAAPTSQAREWHQTCRATTGRWPARLSQCGAWYQINDFTPKYRVLKVNATPAGTFSLTVVRQDRNSITGLSIGYRSSFTAQRVAESAAPAEVAAPNFRPFEPDAPIDMDEPRRHLLAVRHSNGKLDVIRICQTYRITDNAAKNFLINNLHDKLVMYVESDVMVHVDNARDVGSDVRLEARKVWNEVQTYERELQISVRKSQS